MEKEIVFKRQINRKLLCKIQQILEGTFEIKGENVGLIKKLIETEVCELNEKLKGTKNLIKWKKIKGESL